MLVLFSFIYIDPAAFWHRALHRIVRMVVLEKERTANYSFILLFRDDAIHMWRMHAVPLPCAASTVSVCLCVCVRSPSRPPCGCVHAFRSSLPQRDARRIRLLLFCFVAVSVYAMKCILFYVFHAHYIHNDSTARELCVLTDATYQSLIHNIRFICNAIKCIWVKSKRGQASGMGNGFWIFGSRHANTRHAMQPDGNVHLLWQRVDLQNPTHSPIRIGLRRRMTCWISNQIFPATFLIELIFMALQINSFIWLLKSVILQNENTRGATQEPIWPDPFL